MAVNLSQNWRLDMLFTQAEQEAERTRLTLTSVEAEAAIETAEKTADAITEELSSVDHFEAGVQKMKTLWVSLSQLSNRAAEEKRISIPLVDTLLRVVPQTNDAWGTLHTRLGEIRGRLQGPVIQATSHIQSIAQCYLRSKRSAKAKSVYTMLYRCFPWSEALAEEVGIRCFEEGRVEEALTWYDKVKRSSVHLHKMHCYRALGQAALVKKELSTIGFFALESARAVRAYMMAEIDLCQGKKDVACAAVQKVTLLPEWKTSILVEAALQNSDASGNSFRSQYPQLFTLFYSLPKYSPFACTSKDMLVVILDFFALAVDRCPQPFLQEICMERLLKKSPQLFSLDEDLQVVFNECEDAVDELEGLYKKAEALYKALLAVEATVAASECQSEAQVMMRTLCAIFFGGADAVPYSGIVVKSHFYSELLTVFEKKITASAAMIQKFSTLHRRLEATCRNFAALFKGAIYNVETTRYAKYFTIPHRNDNAAFSKQEIVDFMKALSRPVFGLSVSSAQKNKIVASFEFLRDTLTTGNALDVVPVRELR